MKNCELCNGLARIYCESDHANLCWECDLKVHSANFLVAKHSRSLLCDVCQSPTAWSAAGAKIGRTVSVCERCVNDEGFGREEEEEEDDVEDEEEEEEEENEDEDEEEIDLEDIQVVPWSTTTPPPPMSSSSSDESLNSYGNFSLKRMREEDDSGTSTSHREVGAPPAAAAAEKEDNGGDEYVDSFSTRMIMPSKIQRTEESLTGRIETTGCSGTMDLIGRINRQQMNSSGEIAEFCGLGEHLRAVDL